MVRRRIPERWPGRLGRRAASRRDHRGPQACCHDKRYADEVGANEIRSLAPLVVSELARVEVPSALWRRHRLGELSAEDARLLVDAFEAEWFGTSSQPSPFLVVAVAGRVPDGAARMVAAHGLGALDAVQLASAIHVAAAVPERVVFAAFDRDLRRAAAAEGLRPVPA